METPGEGVGEQGGQGAGPLPGVPSGLSKKATCFLLKDVFHVFVIVDMWNNARITDCRDTVSS